MKSKFSNQNIIFEGKGWGSFAFSVRENIVRFPKSNDIDGYKKEEYILKFLQDKISFEIPKPKMVYSDLTYIIHKKLLGESWNINRIKELNSINGFGCLNYLNTDEKLKESMKKSRNECVEKTKTILKNKT